MTSKAEELWEKYKNIITADWHVMERADFLAALREYGAAVRARDIQVCVDRCEADPKNLLRTAVLTDCAAAISREEMP